jgi:cyclophilin family peptidyl-prolyl cis-trans isomerase
LFATLTLAIVILAACGSPAAPQAASAPAEESAIASTETSTDTTSSATIPQANGDRPAAAVAPADRADMYDAPPEMTIDPSKYYYATIKTEKGDIKVQLFADRAPKAVNNFVFLANQGFYDGTTFHRVLDGFMAQAGDPTGTGAGGPGYAFEDEFAPGLGFDRPGLLAMANSGPGTNGSQFFITFAPTEWLNGLHTIFGEVIEGNEVLGELTRRDPNQAPDFEGDLIESITIEEGDESLLPTPTPLPPTPTPFPPTNMENGGDRPLAQLTPEERVGYFNTPPEMTIDPSKTYTATIKTSQGDMVVALETEQAPKAVNNFVVLANLGFYDGTPVNQVTPGQVVIIGSPDNQPTSDAGYQFDAETNLDVVPAIGSIAYIPSQATSADPILHSSSQLLIALIDPPVEANVDFSFFGQVVDGLDVLTALTTEDTVDEIVITEE